MTTTDRKLLEHMTILELTESQAGATCTQTLAWMGANAIRVEPVNTGEPGRYQGQKADASGDSVFFFLHNTSKKSVSLKLHHAEGKDLFGQLVAKADVVVNNLAPGNFERLGWSYELLQDVNPSVIYATISGFGAEGPYSEYPATEIVAEALGGGFGTTGFPDNPPTVPWNNAGESGAGLHATMAILAAYDDRMDTGRSHHVDVVDAGLRHASDPHPSLADLSHRQRLLTQRQPLGHRARRHLSLSTRRTERLCVRVCALTIFRAMWDGCLRAMGREDLIGDERYRETRSRLKHREEVETMFTDWTISKNKYEVFEALGREGVPCGAVLDTADLTENEHFNLHDMMVELKHPVYGPMKVLSCPIKVSDGPITFEPAPQLGADNDAVYGDMLGLDAERLQALREDGVI